MRMPVRGRNDKNVGTQEEAVVNHIYNQPRETSQKRSSITSAKQASLTFAFIAILYAALILFVHIRLDTYPSPKSRDGSEKFEFIEENARDHLEYLSALGSKISGSPANLKAEEYILQQVKEISQHVKPDYKIDVDVQVASGSFTLSYKAAGVGEFTSVYQDLRNVVVKFSPTTTKSSGHSVLMNCHYDTVMDSPGAGDDTASCCVMLEILRALSQSNVSLMHDIIFLFNGAEENILQTSHGFITQHPWAKTIKSFINLDSAGSGGWELVFQTGPEHPWLIKAYIESVPYPHASVLGQEIFQSGLVPGDTDFRIFRDFGHIPGIDIANVKNGYVYHTKYDLPKFIKPGSLQRGGENMMALVLTLATSSKMVDPGEDKHGSMVFFDFVGFFMVYYPQRIAVLMNWTTFAYINIAFIRRFIKDRTDRSGRLRLLLSSIVAVFGTWVIIPGTAVGMAALLYGLGHSLSYFTHTLNLLWIFALPSITAAVGFHYLLKNTFFKTTPAELLVPSLQEANQILWSVILAVLTYFNFMSSFLPIVVTLVPVLVFASRELFGLKTTSIRLSLLAAVVPSMYICYLAYSLLMFLIPIMGRTGTETLSDFLIAGLVSLPVLVCLPFYLGHVYTHKGVKRMLVIHLTIIFLGVASIVFSPLGFPYSSNPEIPSMQRCMLVHYDRNFHNFDGHVIQKDAHIWYKPFDILGTKMLEKHAQAVMEKAKRASCDGVYCGRPYFYPFLAHQKPSKSLDFPASNLHLKRVDVKQEERTFLSDDTVRLHFAMTGPSHVTMFVSEVAKTTVLAWTFGDKVPVRIQLLEEMHKVNTFYIFYAHSGPPNTTLHFSMDIQVHPGKNVDSELLRMGFAGHHLFGPDKVTPELMDLSKQLPPWIVTAQWSATYDEYVF